MSISLWTIALQAINFLVLVWLLQRFLYRPALAVMARRRSEVEEAFEKAEQARQSAQAEQKDYETRQVELETSRQSLLSRAHTEIAADRDKVLKEARSQADALLAETRRQLDEERKAALAEVKGEVAGLAASMATKLLEQLAAEPGTSTALADVALARLESHLGALDAEERQALAEDLAGASESLEVTTAVDLDPETRKRWLDALSRHLGDIRAPVFANDPALIGGVTLRFPHAVLSLAWSEQLELARARMLADEDAR